MPQWVPMGRNKEHRRFLRRLQQLEEERSRTIAEGKEQEATLLQEAAEEAVDEETQRELEAAARSKRASAEEWKRGMGVEGSPRGEPGVEPGEDREAE